MINTRLGSCLIEKELARGETGTVYLASGPGAVAKQVAVKVLHAEANPSQRYRFLHECRVLAGLDHPNIVRLFDVGEANGRQYAAMEYVDASDLHKVVVRRGRVPWHQAVEVMQQVCAALKYCHDRGIVHGNVKLSHLLCATSETAEGSKPLVKVIDFGQSWVFDNNEPSLPRTYAGIPGEMSPEQLDGKPATPRSDVFALGAVLWSLVTGKLFASFVDPLNAKRYERLPSARSISTSIPEALDRLLIEALSVDPAVRPADAGVFLRRLDSIARSGERRPGAKKDTDVPAESPAETMSRLMRAELEQQRAGNWLQYFLNKPVILVVLFLITLSLIVWGFMPPSADSLYASGAELMKSENPRDWETAWTEYLQPLEEKHPDHPHKEEVQQYRKRVEDYRGQKEAAILAARTGPTSEAQWFYLLGLRYRQRGEEDKAQQTWRNLIAVYRHVSLEQPWVKKAEQELSNLQSGKVNNDQRWASIRIAVAKAKQLEVEGKHDDARQLREALREMYKDDPSAREELQQVEGKP